METDDALAQEIMQMLSTGLLKQWETSPTANSPITLLNSVLRRGWEKLSFYLISRDYLFPHSIASLVDLCHSPVSTWDGLGSIYLALGYNEALLEGGQPTEFCEILGRTLADMQFIEQELQDQHFVDLFEICRQISQPDQYAKAREFLLRHPIVLDPFESFASDSSWASEVLSKLKACYEAIPVSAKRGTNKNEVTKCPHCGWTLQRRRNESFCHQGGICGEVHGELHKDENVIIVQPHSMRTKEGIQHYVVAPELSLLRLHDQLSKEWGIRCELFPQLDAYDLLITFSTGVRWALDLKDHRYAKLLALGLNEKPFRYTPSWQRAFYVFPDHRAKPEYMRTFKNYWQPQKNVRVTSVRELMTLVREELD